MRSLRILACGVALATLTALTTGLLQVPEVVPSDREGWIPLAIYPFLALAILLPAVAGLRVQRFRDVGVQLPILRPAAAHQTERLLDLFAPTKATAPTPA